MRVHGSHIDDVPLVTRTTDNQPITLPDKSDDNHLRCSFLDDSAKRRLFLLFGQRARIFPSKLIVGRLVDDLRVAALVNQQRSFVGFAVTLEIELLSNRNLRLA